jgi:hypothetical protein
MEVRITNADLASAVTLMNRLRKTVVGLPPGTAAAALAACLGEVCAEFDVSVQSAMVVVSIAHEVVLKEKTA